MITGMPRIAIAVRDFDATVAMFRETLGLPVIDISARSVESLGAKLAMCVPQGGSNIELMAPADPAAPLSQSLQRFLDHRGEGLFALMLEAEDPNAEAEVLAKRGLNVLPLMAGAGGRDVHPNSTHGVLIRIYPVNSFTGQAEPVVVDDLGSPGLSGVVRVIIAVDDLDHAVSVYGNMFAMEVNQPSIDADRGVRFAICTPPSGGTIELVSIRDQNQPYAKSINRFLDNNRQGMYALVLQSHDLSATEKVLAARGLRLNNSADSSGVPETDRTSTFGTLLRIEPV